jgi:hypothetical protein
MLRWIKKRVRMYEQYDWAQEADFHENQHLSRKTYIQCAFDDYKWMYQNKVLD